MNTYFNFVSKVAGMFGQPVPQKIRSIIQRVLPENPLGTFRKKDSLTVIIPCILKDIWKLKTVIESLEKSVENQIEEIVIITNNDSFLNLKQQSNELGFRIVLENELISESLLLKIHQIVPQDKIGWTIQQVATWRFILSSRSKENFLRLDSDTLLLKKRTFFGDQFHVLFPVVEYEAKYDMGLVKIASNDSLTGFSYVSHHQAISRKNLAYLFEGKNENEVFENWINPSPGNYVPISEYHTYANFALSTFPSSIKVAKWANRRLREETLRALIDTYSTSELLQSLSNLNPDIFSISAHHYVLKDEIKLPKDLQIDFD